MSQQILLVEIWFKVVKKSVNVVDVCVNPDRRQGDLTLLLLPAATAQQTNCCGAFNFICVSRGSYSTFLLFYFGV